jgi:hypothetical protein
MHVIIPVADEPSNPSLPVALASIAEHTDYYPVTVGRDHGLITQHIATVQQPGLTQAFANTDLAVRVACETAWVSDPFILSADDIYWTEPAAPIRWALGNLADAQGSTVYAQRKRATAALLEALGLPTFDYESHTPLLIHKAPMLEALALGGEKRSVYGNLTGLPDHVGPDVKLRRRSEPRPAAPWYSTALPPHRYEAART